VSDIFVSYASADRDRARAVAQALADQGWSVWWDRTIPPGRQFDEVIEEALDSARCVVVLWSRASVASQWVKTEAAEAMRRKILVPVLIEDVKIPLEFRRLQAADLSTWTGGNTHEEMQKFLASIGTNVGQEARPTPPPENQAAEPPQAPPRPPEVKPLPPPPEPLPAARPKSKALLLAAAGLASLVVIAVGYTAYNERVKRQAMEERAERERKAAEEARRAAEEAAARAKLAQEAAAKEAAQRRAEQERRAADDARRAAESAAAARAVKAAQEDAARAKAAQEAAARDAALRAKAAQEEAARKQAAAKQGTTTMRINWYDHALRFAGTLSGKPSSATLQATIYDIKTGAQIGNYDVPAMVSKQGEDFVVTGTFQVPKDSVTPHPHAHTSRLLLRRQSDGSLRFVENCPQAGKQCYR
jgi:hypothetical protein